MVNKLAHDDLKKENLVIKYLNDNRQLFFEIMNRQNSKGERLAIVVKVKKNKNFFQVTNVHYSIEEQIINENIKKEVKKYDTSNQMVIVIIDDTYNNINKNYEKLHLITINFLPQITSDM
jgi:hypothetical protein